MQLEEEEDEIEKILRKRRDDEVRPKLLRKKREKSNSL